MCPLYHVHFILLSVVSAVGVWIVDVFMFFLPYRCREHYRNHHQLIGGDSINRTVHTVFAALLWHTPVLREDIERYGTVFSIICSK